MRRPFNIRPFVSRMQNPAGRGFLSAVFMIVLSGWMAAPVFAQQSAGPTPVSASSENGNKAGLGGYVMDSLKDLIQSGSMFVPNGMSAHPVESATPGEPKKFKLNFNNAPIDQVLKFLSDMTEKLVIKTQDVNGQFTIMNPKDVTKEEAMHIIDTVFRLQDITLQETDQMIIVLPLSAARTKLGSVKTSGDELSASVQSKAIELKFAVPSQMKEALSSLVADPANMIADDRTKTLVITDTLANINRLENIINQLDKETMKEGVSMRVFRLRYLDAREISRDLDTMLQNIVMGKLTGGNLRDLRDQASYTSEVIADRATNSLIIAAPDYALEEIAKYLEQLDVSSVKDMTTKTVALVNADAQQVAQGLQQFTQSRRTNFYTPVVFADSRTNSVVIHAYPEDVEMIVDVLKELDQKQSHDRETRVFILENADAVVLSDMVQQLLTGENSSQNRRNYWSYYGRNQQSEDEIKIVQDQRLNALIISAKPADFPMVEELIHALDEPVSNSKEEPKVYHIKNVRASDVASMLTQIFTSDNNRSYGYYFGFDDQQQGITGFNGKVKCIADSTTNSLIVIAAMPRAFEVVEKLIKQLDQLSPEFGTTKVFHLKNADAGYLASQLNSLFQQDSSQRGNQGFFWYLNQQSNRNEPISNMIGNVRIVSETRTNSLLVTTSSQYFDAIQELINNLDREIQQILVEILIVEIVDVQDDQWGIDWQDNIPISTEATFQAPLSGINLERASVLTSAKYDLVLDMLASNSKTNVIARPNILTGDNQKAYVEVINRVPRPSQLSQSNSSTLQSITYEDVGLTLNVSPHINDATTVTLEVNLTDGQVLDQYSMVSSDTTIPAYSRRTIQTRLTIQNKETAVLSGVIDTRFVNKENGIPVLMHIPVLGNLFKTKGKTNSKTELLTFITPYILANQKDRQEVLERQSDRINMYKDFKSMMKDIQVKVGVN